MLQKAVKVDFMIVQSESEALYLEDNLIKKHKPMYNSLLKGDNSYVYIKITPHPYPLVTTTRMRYNDGSLYVGPKHSTRELYKLMQFLRQFLRYRSCGLTVFKQGKICSDYHFGTCGGWCVYAKYAEKLTTHEDRESLEGKRTVARPALPIVNSSFVPVMTADDSVKANKDIQKTIVDFFSGKTKPLQEQILAQIHEAVDLQRFERAAQLRDVYQHMHTFTEKQTAVISDMVSGKMMKIIQME
jgi:excinuclease ABC subunit C